MYELTHSKAEQSRAEQSRAEQSSSLTLKNSIFDIPKASD